MLTPEYLLNISEGAEEIAEYLHTDIINRIIERIMIRLERGEEYILTSVIILSDCYHDMVGVFVIS